MDKVFLFGKFYKKDELNDTLYLMNSKTPYEINKNTFISETYDNNNTMEKLYNYFKNNTIGMEKIKNKDLMYFNMDELRNLMSSLPTANLATKEKIYYLIKSYLDWAVSKQYISINNILSLSKDELCKVNKKMASYKYTDIKTLDILCEDAVKSGEVSVIDVMPLIIARYGILGKKMSKLINLTKSDIDIENMIVRIFNEEIRDELDNEIVVKNESFSTYPIDEIFLKWIGKAKFCTEFKGVPYIDEGKIIKRWEKLDELNITTLNNRLTRVFEMTSIQRTSLKSLEFSRKVDLLLEIRKERVLKSMDFRKLTINFDSNVSPATTNVLIREYESLTEDKVQPMRSKDKVKYTDSNPKETVKNIKKGLGIEE